MTEKALERIYMKQKYLLIPLFLILSSCSSTPVIHNEDMLNDGNTWRVTMGAFMSGCRGLYSGSSSCVKAIKPYIWSRGERLCGHKPKSVRACARIGSENKVECMVQCK